MADEKPSRGPSLGQPLAIFILLACLVLLARTLIPQEKLNIRGSVIASYPFDGSFARRLSVQSGPSVEGKNVSFEPSKFGQSVKIGPSSALSLSLPLNWNLAATGMISFWFKTDGDAADGTFYRLLQIPDADLSLHKDEYNRLIFRIGDRWMTVPARWAANHWNHVAVGWARNEGAPEGDMALYLNGRKVAQSFGPGAGRFEGSKSEMTLRLASTAAGGGFSGGIDELLIFNRILTEREVRSIYGYGVRVSDLAVGKDIPLALPFENLAHGKAVTGSVKAAKKWKAYTNLTNGVVDNDTYATNGPDGKGLNYLQVDLGEKMGFNEIHLWHDFSGKYLHNKLEISPTGEFKGEQTLIFDSDREGPYEESPFGKTFRFDTVTARYIRNWIQGSEPLELNRWVQLQAFYDEFPLPSSVPEVTEAGPKVNHRVLEKADGIGLFAPPPFTAVLPENRPLVEWVGKPVEAVGVPGQIVPAALGVRSETDLGEVRLTVDPIADETGAETARLDANVVLVKDRPSGLGVDRKTTERVPLLLIKDDRTPLKGVFPKTGDFPEVRLDGDPATEIAARITKIFWINCSISPDAKPGMYKSTIRLMGKSGEAARAELKLTVLPLKLEKPERKTWGIFFQLPLSDKPRDQLDQHLREYEYPYFDAENMARYLKDVHDHGFNMAAMLTQHYTGPDSPLAKLMLLARDNGLTGPISVVHDLWAYQDDIKKKRIGFTLSEYIEAVEGFGKENGIAPTAFYQEDEPTAQMVKKIRERAPIIHEHGGLTIAAILGKISHPAVAEVDYPVLMLEPAAGARATADALRAMKKPAWYYYQIWAVPAERARMATGYQFWLRNFEGIMPYTYMRVFGDPFDDFDGHQKEFCMAFPTKNGPLDTIGWEASREGVYDYEAAAYFIATADRVRRERQTDLEALDSLEKIRSEFWDAMERQLYFLNVSCMKDRNDIFRAVLKLKDLSEGTKDAAKYLP